MSAILAVLAPTLTGNAAESGYVAPHRCRPCHVEIFDSYARSGMARSFAAMKSVPLLEDWNARFSHQRSGRFYSVARRGGEFYLRRTLPGDRDAIEKQIHYVVGLDNHSRGGAGIYQFSARCKR